MKAPELSIALGLEVRELRKAQKISQKELGYRVGLERTYISRLERGISLPPLGVIADLAKAFGLTASQLIANVEKRLGS